MARITVPSASAPAAAAPTTDAAREAYVPARLSDASLRADFVSAVVVAGAGIDPAGATDSTAAIQAKLDSLTSGGIAIFPPGIYSVASTLTLSKSNVTITGQPGAQIRPSASPSGALKSAGRIFDLPGVSNVSLTGLTFLPPASAASYTLSDGESGGVHLSNTVNCTVADCVFTGSASQFGIFVTGPTAADNNILRNNLAGCGVVYSYNGASRTVCAQNTVTNSPGNSLNGVGNGASDGADCVVSQNRVYSSARMGIEDVQAMRGTKIINNVIRGSGTNPANVTSGACFGISAVGRMALVQGNTVIDSPSYSIEVAGNGVRVLNNYVKQVNASLVSTGHGVFINAGTLAGESRGAVVRDNTILDLAYGVMAWHDCGVVLIEGNTIEDCLNTGVACDTDDAQTQISVVGNYLRYTKALTGGAARVGISTFSSSGAGARGVVIGRNCISYEASAGTSANGWEVAIRPATNDMLIEGNVIDGGNIAPNGQAPGISTQGATITGARVLNNTLLRGATLDTTGMTAVDVTGKQYIDAGDTSSRARANHTGTQLASTITGLAPVAISGAYGDLSGKPSIPVLSGPNAWTGTQDFSGATVTGISGGTGGGPTLPVPASGQYWIPITPTSPGTSNGNGINTLRLLPFFAGHSLSIARVGAEVTTIGDAGSKVRLGIYADNGNAAPGALLLDAGTIAGDSAAVQEIILGSSLALPGGMYWIGAVVQAVTTTQPTLRMASLNQNLPIAHGSSMPGVGSSGTCYQQLNVSGALPATASASVAIGGAGAPRLFLKVA